MQKVLTSKNGRWTSVLLCLLVVVGLVAVQSAAGEDTNTHVKGIVKSIDKASLVITTHDGAEQKFTLTNSTIMAGTSGNGGPINSGRPVIVMFTENGGIKTATEVRGLPRTQPQN